MASVDIKNITVGYGKDTVLKNVSLQVEDGESLAIVGPSSCGKTTLLRALCGFNKVTTGDIYIGNNLVSSAEKKKMVAPERRKIGVVFQDYAVWPQMTVLENVAYPLKKQKVKKEEAKKRALKAIEQVKMSEYANRLPAQLSGGQQQRVALARALVASQNVIVLDEPITNLDKKLREEMSYEIQNLQKTLGVTILYITHDQETAMTIADRIAIMSETGDIVQIGKPEDIWMNPINQYVYKFLGVSNFLPVVFENGALKLKDTDMSYPIKDESLQEGKKYLMASRPIEIVLNEVEDNDVGFIAKMERVTYLGNQYDYQLSLGKYDLRVHQDSFEALKGQVPVEGKQYRVTFSYPKFYDDDRS